LKSGVKGLKKCEQTYIYIYIYIWASFISSKIILYDMKLYYTILYHITSYYIILYHIMLYYIILYYVISYHIISYIISYYLYKNPNMGRTDRLSWWCFVVLMQKKRVNIKKNCPPWYGPVNFNPQSLTLHSWLLTVIANCEKSKGKWSKVSSAMYWYTIFAKFQDRYLILTWFFRLLKLGIFGNCVNFVLLCWQV
jgi:hypothetical protein